MLLKLNLDIALTGEQVKLLNEGKLKIEVNPILTSHLDSTGKISVNISQPTQTTQATQTEDESDSESEDSENEQDSEDEDTDEEEDERRESMEEDIENTKRKISKIDEIIRCADKSENPFFDGLLKMKKELLTSLELQTKLLELYDLI